jgi:hypothetical protein
MNQQHGERENSEYSNPTVRHSASRRRTALSGALPR